MRAKFLTTILVLAAAVLAASAQERASREAEPAEWVPADALIYIGVTDTERLWSDFKKSSGYRQMQDKEYLAQIEGGEMISSFIEKFRGRIAELLKVEPDALKSPFGGPLAIWASAPAGASVDDMESGMIATVADKELMQRYLDAALANLKEHAKEYDTFTAGGATVHSFKFDPDTEWGDEEEEEEEEFDFGPPNPLKEIESTLDEVFSPKALPESLALALSDDRFYVAGSDDQMRRMVTRKKGADTLAETDDHRALLKHLRPVGEVRMLVNLPRLFDLIKREAEGNDAEELRTVLSMLGADSLRSMVGHMRFGARSYDSKLELLFLMSGERTGLAKLLSMTNVDVTPADTVPAGSVIYFSANINPPEFIKQIAQMAERSDPAAAAQVNMALGEQDFGGQKVHVQKDIIDHLTGPLRGYLSFQQPYDPNAVQLALSLGHRNRDALSRVFGILMGLSGLQPREFQGTQVYDIPSPMGPPTALAVSSDAIVVGLAPSVEARLSAKGSSDSLAAAKLFRDAQRLVPKEAWLTVFFDEGGLLKASSELAKNPATMQNPVGQAMMMIAQMIDAKITDEAYVKKALQYKSATIVTAATTTEGVQLSFVTLKPPSE